ncbi:MAG: hypothetical protein ACP6IU_13045 [Candidatus Asgardarchaeia archaeon]
MPEIDLDRINEIYDMLIEIKQTALKTMSEFYERWAKKPDAVLKQEAKKKLQTFKELIDTIDDALIIIFVFKNKKEGVSDAHKSFEA